MKLIKHSIAASLLSLALIAGQITPVVLLGGLVVTQTACPEAKDAASIANRVGKGLGTAIKVYAAEGLETAKLIKAQGLAFKTRDAFNAADSAEGVELLRQLIGVFEDEILAQIAKITDPVKRTLAMAALMIVQDQLLELAKKVDKAPAEVQSMTRTRAPQAIEAVERFAKKKKWRCRNSITGKFASMDHCRSNPASSTVETF